MSDAGGDGVRGVGMMEDLEGDGTASGVSECSWNVDSMKVKGMVAMKVLL